MGKEMTRTAYRDEIMEKVRMFLEREYETDARYIGSGEIMLPAVDENGDEFYFTFKAAIPRGKRNGAGGYVPFDGYAAADEYAADLEAKKLEQEIKRKEKERKAAEKERLKAAKRTVKKLNKDGFEKMVKEGE